MFHGQASSPNNRFAAKSFGVNGDTLKQLYSIYEFFWRIDKVVQSGI